MVRFALAARTLLTSKVPVSTIATEDYGYEDFDVFTDRPGETPE